MKKAIGVGEKEKADGWEEEGGSGDFENHGREKGSGLGAKFRLLN